MKMLHTKLYLALLIGASIPVVSHATGSHDHEPSQEVPVMAMSKTITDDAALEHNENTHEASSRDKEKHDEHEHEDEESVTLIEMSAAKQAMAGVVVAAVELNKGVEQTLNAPGELVNNQYNTTQVSTQLKAQVLERHVILGQWVRAGDPIVTLFSLDMADIQGQLKIAAEEWSRVKFLGRDTVGSKRYTETQVAYQQLRAKVLAAGMSDSALKASLEGKDSKELGLFTLLAPHDGVVLNDNFQQGQLLADGSAIITLVDEDVLWVEAKLSPQIGQEIPRGTKATVMVDNQMFEAEVIQETHAIDEVTRTRNIRLRLVNHKHLLHPGLFAEVTLKLPVSGSVILVPQGALMRSTDGDWVVFVEQSPGQFKPKEVELKNTIDDYYWVEGLDAGQRIAVEGAFFLASELAKGGFDPHNH